MDQLTALRSKTPFGEFRNNDTNFVAKIPNDFSDRVLKSDISNYSQALIKSNFFLEQQYSKIEEKQI